MKAWLRDRYFPDLAKIEREEADEASRQLGSVKEFVSREGFRALKEWLELQMKAYRPKPDSPEAMMYQVGVSDGLQIVNERLQTLEHEARQEDD